MSAITKATSGPLTGFSRLTFDVQKALSILHYLQAAGYSYGLGCKPYDYSASPPVCIDELGEYGGGTVKRLDCSAFHKYVSLHAAGLVIPDGSSNQNDFYAANGFKHHRTTQANGPDYLTGMASNCLYACFCRAGTRNESIGHVWYALCLNGRWETMESHGGAGPDSRPVNTAILSQICTDFYPIAVIS